MIIVVQRVLNASVDVDGKTVGAISRGLLLLIGVAEGDGSAQAQALATRVAKLRVFPNASGKLDLNVIEAGGQLLAVSQFTLVADLSKGNRPSFHRAARPEAAEPVFRTCVEALAAATGRTVATGVFGAEMRVNLANDGPLTLVLEA